MITYKIKEEKKKTTFGFVRICTLFVILHILPVFIVNAGVPLFQHIERLGLKEGLSNSEVRCIFQDHKGFIWFGTYSGLNRYDGYDFRVYRNQPEDSTSIIHSYVNCIAEDGHNNLWLGTRQGVSILNPLFEKFSPAYATGPGSKRFKISTYVKYIYKDAHGRMYVATLGNGLIVFQPGSHEGQTIPLIPSHGSEWNYVVDAMIVMPGEKIYLVISKVGLCSFDIRAKKITVINTSVMSATCLYPDGKYVWVGTNQGLYRFDPDQPLTVLKEFSALFRSKRITSLQSMPDGSLWIGTDGGGIQIFDRGRTNITYLGAGNDERTLSSNAVYALLLDKEGRKWIGTLRGGINVVDNVKDRFQNIQHNPLDANSLISNFVKSVFEDREGKIWIGTDGGGLSIWDRKLGRFTNFKPDTAPGSISSNFITGIIQDNTGRVWISTFGDGIDLYDSVNKRFKVYHGLDAQGKPTRMVFWGFCLDHTGRLWASGLQDGLFLYDPQTDQFNLYDSRLTNILTLCEDNEGILWGGGFDGLFRIDKRKKTYQLYKIGRPVRSIHKASDGNLWLGTEAGLMYFQTSSKSVTKQYTMKAGLSDNNVLAIEEANGKLWLSTYYGLSRFDPANNSFTNFFQSDGLASKEFNFNASVKLKNGQLGFGSLGGLTLFNPNALIPLRNEPVIALTDIKINQRPLNARPSYVRADDQQTLSSLTVPYSDASFLFRYAAIEFTAQERIRYRYMLEGWDRSWVDADGQRNIFYTRLPPGSYTLKINCSNAEGQWLTNMLTLRIIVLPPWYATIWAYLLYLMVIAGLIYWYVRNKIKENRLNYEIQLANADAAYQRNLQEKEREINERRVEFFTGVSHEFRTPLSLIINPIKDLLIKSDAADQKELNIIYRNSRRLLSLVDQLLLFRKADAPLDILHVAAMDISLVCREVFLCFVQQAKIAEIKFELEIPAEQLIIYGDREKIEIILFNLISNAIKYTPHGKTVIVKIINGTNDLLIKVSDHGPGISTDASAHIFEKFYRSAKQGKKGGFGIGLYLAQQFTQEHHGQLTFSSTLGQGTTFCLKLQKGINHFPGIELTESVDLVSPLLDELTEVPVNLESLETSKEVMFDADELLKGRKTILVIDDDQEIRKYIRSILETAYLIYEADSGQTGFTKAKERQPDMIICDVMMPGMNGIELCATIKKDQALSYIPMILLTASSSPENKIKGLESGADDYIQKPFEKDVLIARIANILQTRDNLQQYFFNTITLNTVDINIADEYKHFLKKCIEIVERHITDEDFSVKVLVAEIGMSHSNLYRKVKSLSGHTINSFIRYIRLRKAAELLIQSDMNVNEVAFETGFISVKYFRTQFFKLFGTNPSDFLKQKRSVFKKK